MKSKRELYYLLNVNGDSQPFERWNFEKIIAHRASWKPRRSHVVVCVTALCSSGKKSEVHSGTEMPNTGARRKVYFAILIPPYRNYRTNQIKDLIASGDGLRNKCKIGMKKALELGLEYEIES